MELFEGERNRKEKNFIQKNSCSIPFPLSMSGPGHNKKLCKLQKGSQLRINNKILKIEYDMA